MKKIIALLALFLAFSINASAQDNASQVEKNAKKDVEALMQVIKIEDNMQMAFFKLFKKKHEGFMAPNITEATKREIRAAIESKLRATLNNEQTITLEKNKAVFSQLVGEPVAGATMTVKK